MTDNGPTSPYGLTQQQLETLETQLLDDPDCVHPGAPRSVSRDHVIPVHVVMRILRGEPTPW